MGARHGLSAFHASPHFSHTRTTPGAIVPLDRSRFPSLTSWRALLWPAEESSGLDFRQEMRLTSEPPLHSPSLHYASVSSNVPWASHTSLRVVGTAEGGCISGLLVQLWYGTRATLLPRLHGSLSWGRVLEPGVRTKCSKAEPWLPLGPQLQALAFIRGHDLWAQVAGKASPDVAPDTYERSRESSTRITRWPHPRPVLPAHSLPFCLLLAHRGWHGWMASLAQWTWV